MTETDDLAKGFTIFDSSSNSKALRREHARPEGPVIDGDEFGTDRVWARRRGYTGLETGHRHEGTVEVQVDVSRVRDEVERRDGHDPSSIQAKSHLDRGRVATDDRASPRRGELEPRRGGGAREQRTGVDDERERCPQAEGSDRNRREADPCDAP